ncbi:MAG TPA: Hsp20/alpha crystallin family protein [candidate division WOR-3 bacterium]|uniref:Hsp20/alpha crystallin family protein n=1 Tax=candidate division WOR-3 bacterium TaxID=2052148 RepID=A0A7V0T6N6_UNCW3|nr:Hsp20/alpha crystallin family protein [candidate division WOR-3 bacterium]
MAKNLVRWDPFREVTSLRDDIERLFDSVYGRYPRERSEISWAPPLDIEETDTNIVIRAEIPGMKKDDIKISLTGDTLCISGERRHEAEQKEKTFHRIERAYGRFLRTLALPADVDGAKVKAGYKDGVLELTLPKSEKARSRDIAIEG